MNTEEMTLDLMDFIRRCVKRWKIIVICMVVGGILLNGVGYLRSIKMVNAVKEQVEKEQDESNKHNTINECMENLSEQEIKDVNELVVKYECYNKKYEDTLDYYQHSIKMKLNSQNVPTIRLAYYIDNHFEVTYPVIEKKDTTQDIISIFKEKVINENVINDVADILGVKDNKAYVGEVLNTPLSNDNILIVYIAAENRKDCESIADIIKKSVEKSTNEVRELCGEFDIELVSEKYYEDIDRELADTQWSVVESINVLRDYIKNLPAGLSEDQKAYYDALVYDSKMEATTNRNEEKTEDELNVTSIVVPTVQHINLKFIILGIALGLVFPCGCIFLKYLLSSKIRVPEEVENVFGLTVLGHITDQTAKCPTIFKKYYHHLTSEEQMKLIVSEIHVIAEKEELKKIFITTSAMTERSKCICEEISRAVNEIGVECSFEKSVLFDPQAVKTMANADGVIFVEQIDISRYEEIAKEKEISIQSHIKSLGVVVVE